MQAGTEWLLAGEGSHSLLQDRGKQAEGRGEGERGGRGRRRQHTSGALAGGGVRLGLLQHSKARQREATRMSASSPTHTLLSLTGYTKARLRPALARTVSPPSTPAHRARQGTATRTPRPTDRTKGPEMGTDWG